MGYRIVEHEEIGSAESDAAAGSAAAAQSEAVAGSAAAAESAATESDALVELGDRIAELAAHLHAGTHRLLRLVAEFDARRGWEAEGHRSCAHWLHFRTGFDLGACREKVRTANALAELPHTSAAMAEGALSFAKVRALTRIATTDNETELLEYARSGTARQLEQLVRSWKRFSREDEHSRERVLHRTRTVSIVPDEDGMYVLRGRLDPEVGAVLMRAIEAASDALYRSEPRSTADDSDGITPAERRADALGLLAERALQAGFGAEGSAGFEGIRGVEGSGGGVSHEHPAPLSGGRAERFQVLLHVDADTLDSEAEPGRSHLEDGVRVSAETSRRLSCDAGLVQVTTGEQGKILDVGRRTRTIPPSIRRALDVRDGGCRFPGCGLRFTEAHHIEHWADGGPTKLDNLLLLCRHHHRLVHEEGWRVRWPAGCVPEFLSPGGVTVRRGTARLDRAATCAATSTGTKAGSPGASPFDPASELASALVEQNHHHGVRPDWRTASATWRRDDEIELGVIALVLEALEGAGVSAET